MLEIGVGGGRVARQVAQRCEELHCVDISKEMIKKAKSNLSDFPLITYHLSTVSPDFPAEVKLAAPFDFIYSFDVFVHVDLHTFYQTLLFLHPLLKPDGSTHLFFSLANLCSDLGFDRFKKQKTHKVAGFCCIFTLCLQ